MTKEMACLYEKQIDLLLSKHDLTAKTPEWHKKYVKLLIISKITRSIYPTLFMIGDFLLALLFIWIFSCLLSIYQKDIHLLLILVLISVGNVITLTGIEWFKDAKRKQIEGQCQEYLSRRLKVLTNP